MRLQCPNCGTVVEERPGEPTVCPKCGFSGDAPSETESPPENPYAATSPYSAAPYGASPASTPWGAPSGPVPQGQGQGYGPGSPPHPQAQPTNGMAIASLVMGITGFCVGITAILAIIFGVIGLNQARERGEKGEGMAITGIVLGAVVVIFGLLWFLFVFAAIGGMGYVVPGGGA